MFTRSTLQRLSFAFTLVSFFGLLPYDWCRIKHRFTKTKWKYKSICNKLFAICIPLIIFYCVISFIIDLYITQIDISVILILTMYLIMGLLVCLCPLNMGLEADMVVLLLNGVLELDETLQDMFLTPEEIETYQNKPSITVIMSNVIEPLSIIHTIALSMLFWEEFDPFKRYFYRHIQNFFGLESITYDILALAVYMGFLRLCYGSLVLLAFTATPYLESTTFWLDYISNIGPSNDKTHLLTQKRFKNLRWFLTTESILGKILKGSYFIQYFLPVIFTGIFTPIVIQLYGTVKLAGKLNFGTYIFLPSMSILLISFIRVWFKEAGRIELLSKEMKRHWLEKISYSTKNGNHNLYSKRNIELQKYFIAFQPLTFSLNNLFGCNLTTFLLFLEQVIDKTVTLLVSIKHEN